MQKYAEIGQLSKQFAFFFEKYAEKSNIICRKNIKKYAITVNKQKKTIF